MQDYFASTAQTDDSRVLMSLMRHTNLTTTTKYLRAMQRAVKALGINRALDRRTATGKAIAHWRQDLIADLGGNVSTQ